MASVVGITLVKSFTYRGDASEEFSNQYHLTGSIPADDAAWLTLVAALAAQEKTVYPSWVTIVRAYGYSSDDPAAPSVYVHDYSGSPIAGTLATSGGLAAAGDAAVWVRWKTSRLNSKGKAIYLRKYFHGAMTSSSTPGDAVLAAQTTALNAFGTKMYDASFAESRTIRSMGHAETITSRSSSPWITTRTLKRRGKRPSS